MIALGPACIAPIDYLKKFGVAIILEKPEDFIPKMEEVVKRPDMIVESANVKYKCALQNHKNPLLLKKMRDLMKDDIVIK